MMVYLYTLVQSFSMRWSFATILYETVSAFWRIRYERCCSVLAFSASGGPGSSVKVCLRP